VLEHWRYPFLPTSSRIIEGIALNSLLSDYFYAEARALAINRLETSASSGIIEVEGPPINNESDIVIGYLISRLVLSAADNQALVNYAALSEARRAERFLSKENNFTIVEFAKLLGINSARSVKSNFEINFIDYVRAASNLREGDWKLSNAGVSNGIVVLRRRKFVRLMREVVRQNLEELPEAPAEIRQQFEGPIDDLKSTVSNAFTERIGSLNTVVDERQAESMKELGRFDLSKAPPCFNRNLMDLQAGVNLSHPSRFFLTTFLSSLNQDPESVMRLFATAPDFKEAFTRYQVEHITGKTSSTQYSSPKCDTLVSSGVCPGPNALCRQIKHPLSYYRVMAESEKPIENRMERIFLAALDREEYPSRLLEKNMANLGEISFNYPDELETKRLSEALKSKHFIRVDANVSHFQSRVSSIKLPDEDKGIWITKAMVGLTDGNREYECLPLTDWKVALPIADAKFKSQKISLVVKTVEIFLSEDESPRKIILIVDKIDEL